MLYVNSTVALQVIFLLAAFSYLLHSLYLFVSHIMYSQECVFATDASLHPWLYELLLSTNYILKMTPECRIDASIIPLSLEVKRETFRVLEKEITDCWLQRHVVLMDDRPIVSGRYSAAWNIKCTVSSQRYTVSYTEPKHISQLNVFLIGFVVYSKLRGYCENTWISYLSLALRLKIWNEKVFISNWSCGFHFRSLVKGTVELWAWQILEEKKKKMPLMLGPSIFNPPALQ